MLARIGVGCGVALSLCAWAFGAPGATTGTLVVANKAAHTASVIDLATGETVHATTGVGPHEAAVSPDGRLAAISEYGVKIGGNTIRLLSLPEGDDVGRIDLGEFNRPHGMAFTPDNARLVITSETRKRVVVVDLEKDRVVTTIDTTAEGSHMVVLSPDGRRAYTTNVGSHSVSVLDLDKGTLVRVIETAPAPEALTLSPDGAFLWIGCRGTNEIQVIDTGALEIVATIDCPGMPFRLAFTPDGTRVLATCAVSGDLAVFDAKARTLEQRVALTIPNTHQERVEPSPPGYPDIVPLGIIAPVEHVAFVTIANASLVAEVDLRTGTVVRSFATGAGPDGVAYSPLAIDLEAE